MAYKCDNTKCIGCHTCTGICPVGAISVAADGKCAIDINKCISCGTCASICPVTAIEPNLQ